MAKKDQRRSMGDIFTANNNIDLFLLDSLTEEQLEIGHSNRSRNIADQFAHLHNVRIMWVEASKPALAKTLKKIEKGKSKKKILRENLVASAAVMAQYLDELEVSERSKKGPNEFFAYVIAHEAHHRGQILLHLKYAGVALDKEKSFLLWEWGKF
jgi:uncharacterized damage-inducible protein DinB